MSHPHPINKLYINNNSRKLSPFLDFGVNIAYSQLLRNPSVVSNVNTYIYGNVCWMMPYQAAKYSQHETENHNQDYSQVSDLLPNRY